MNKMKQLLNGKKTVLVPPSWYNEIEKLSGFKEAERFDKEQKPIRKKSKKGGK